MIFDRLLGRAGRRGAQPRPPAPGHEGGREERHSGVATAVRSDAPAVPSAPAAAPTAAAPAVPTAPEPPPSAASAPSVAPAPTAAPASRPAPAPPVGEPSSPPPARGAVPGGASVRGAVVTRDGWPLPGATVTVLSGAGAASARTTTGNDGSFAVLDLPAGSATVLLAAPGHEPQVRAVTVTAASGAAGAPGTGGVLEVGTVRLVRQDDLSLPPAGRWVIDPLHTSIVATAHHLGLSSVRGRLDLTEGLITIAEPFTASTVEVTIGAASIDTGVASRDDHLRSGDFLDVDTHPLITYRGTGLVATAGGGWTMRGHLTLLGQVREVPLDLEATGTGQDPWGGTRTAFRATTTLSRDDFHMNWNQAVGLGITVFGTTLRVTIDLEAVLQP